ncbi:MAG: LPS export ABC transporter periplasmic protein LptC [Terriglobales bacterium]
MPLNVERLRKWFLLAAIVLVAMVLGSYLYLRHRERRAVTETAQRLEVDVQQSTQGFTLSKSEGGRTLFTIRAGKAVQYKASGRATLEDVSIVVYGRKSERYDQIYGSQFEYDASTGEVAARGEVHIDLEAAGGEARPDQAPPPELKNPIHLKTSGLVFNQKTGIADTRERIEFRIPQGTGSALGVRYDSKANLLTFGSEVRVKTTGREGAEIRAARAVISKEPRQAVLEGVKIEQQGRTLEAAKAVVFLRENNTVERIAAEGNVSASEGGEHSVVVRAPRGEFRMGEKDDLRSGELAGGVTLEAGGLPAVSGRASRVAMEFGRENRLSRVRALGRVRLQQTPAPPAKGKGKNLQSQPLELSAETVDLIVAEGRRLERAMITGSPQFKLLPVAGSAPASQATTTVSAEQFQASFESGNRVRALHGAPQARIVSSTPGQPDKVSTSRELDVLFDRSGAIAGVVQQGGVRYSEGTRQASGERGRYLPAEDTVELSGSPQATDGPLTISGALLRLHRRSGEAEAEGGVKTTYRVAGRQAGGALFASEDPIHATAASMSAHPPMAHYAGGARLWQGSNIVQAPTIDFDRDHRSLVAQGSAAQPVSTVFVQPDKQGKPTAVSVTGARLTYSDQERRARFEGGVTLKSADQTVTAEAMEVFLLPASEKGKPASGGASRVERVVATGKVVVEAPGRRATGTRLVYTAAEGKFELTGDAAHPPSITDADRGTATGDSVTFYNHGDRVVVGSNTASRTVTQTQVQK